MKNKLSNFFKVPINTLLNLATSLQSFNIYKDINYHFLASNLKLLRIKNKLSQKEFALTMNLSHNTISKYENNPHNISVAFLIDLGLKYHISIDYFCGKTLKKEV